MVDAKKLRTRGALDDSSYVEIAKSAIAGDHELASFLVLRSEGEGFKVVTLHLSRHEDEHCIGDKL